MKILVHGRAFPVAMWRFFAWAFQDLGHQVYTVGPYSDGKIPWGDYYYPEHKFPPDFVLPDADVPLEEVLKRIPFKPDMVFQAADSIFLTGKSPVPNCMLLTDPHAVDYSLRRINADFVFNMQKHYSMPRDIWIPYAFEPNIHKYKKLPIKFDVVFCGLQYDHRKFALETMHEEGVNVLNTLGLIYEEYVDAYNSGKIAFNWSSKQDLPARFWEGLAMKRMVLTNRVPDLKELEFIEGEDYVGFSTADEAVEKALFYLSKPDLCNKIAENGFRKVKLHTYKARCQKILEAVNI